MRAIFGAKIAILSLLVRIYRTIKMNEGGRRAISQNAFSPLLPPDLYEREIPQNRTEQNRTESYTVDEMFWVLGFGRARGQR